MYLLNSKMCRSESVDIVFDLVDMESSIKAKLSSSNDQRVRILLLSTLKRIQDELNRERSKRKRRQVLSECSPTPKKLKVIETDDLMVTETDYEDDVLGLNDFFTKLSAIKRRCDGDFQLLIILNRMQFFSAASHDEEEDSARLKHLQIVAPVHSTLLCVVAQATFIICDMYCTNMIAFHGYQYISILNRKI